MHQSDLEVYYFAGVLRYPRAAFQQCWIDIPVRSGRYSSVIRPILPLPQSDQNATMARKMIRARLRKYLGPILRQRL